MHYGIGDKSSFRFIIVMRCQAAILRAIQQTQSAKSESCSVRSLVSINNIVDKENDALLDKIGIGQGGRVGSAYTLNEGKVVPQLNISYLGSENTRSNTISKSYNHLVEHQGPSGSVKFPTLSVSRREDSRAETSKGSSEVSDGSALLLSMPTGS